MEHLTVEHLEIIALIVFIGVCAPIIAWMVFKYSIFVEKTRTEVTIARIKASDTNDIEGLSLDIAADAAGGVWWGNDTGHGWEWTWMPSNEHPQTERDDHIEDHLGQAMSNGDLAEYFGGLTMKTYYKDSEHYTGAVERMKHILNRHRPIKPVTDLTELAQDWRDTGRLLDLIQAVKKLYFVGHWTCDRPCDEAAIWASLRDAAGIKAGNAPIPTTVVNPRGDAEQLPKAVDQGVLRKSPSVDSEAFDGRRQETDGACGCGDGLS